MNTALLLLCLGSFFLCNCHSSIISDNKPSSHVSINRHDTLANCNGINDVGSNNNVSSNGGINNVNVTSAFEIAFSITPSNIRLLVVCISLQINLDTNSSIDWTFDLLPPLESFDSQNSQNSQSTSRAGEAHPNSAIIMVECAHCKTHFPNTESIDYLGETFCSIEHKNLGRK